MDNKKVYYILVPLIIIFLSVNGYMLYRYFNGRNSKNNVTQENADLTNVQAIQKNAKPTAKPTPIPLKPDDGLKGTFNIGQAAHMGPDIRKMVLNPLDVKKGQKLGIELQLENGVVIDSVSLEFTMDNSIKNVDLTRISRVGIAEVWKVEVPIDDTVDYKYLLKFKAKASNGDSEATIPIRI